MAPKMARQVMERRQARELLERLTRDADRICVRFGLRYKEIAAERANVKSRYGVCYSDGTIKIRLRHATTGDALKYSSLVSTLCHELAHLRHFDHGARFQALYARLLDWARREGIYRPGAALRPTLVLAPVANPLQPPSPSAPRQLDLFGGEAAQVHPMAGGSRR
jgi:hypothetical protein